MLTNTIITNTIKKAIPVILIGLLFAGIMFTFASAIFYIIDPTDGTTQEWIDQSIPLYLDDPVGDPTSGRADEDIVNTWYAIEDQDADEIGDWIYFLLEVNDPSSALALSNRAAAAVIDCDRDGNFQEFGDRIIAFRTDLEQVFALHGDQTGQAWADPETHGQTVGNKVEWGIDLSILASFPDQTTPSDYCQDIGDNITLATVNSPDTEPGTIIDQTEFTVLQADFSATPTSGVAPLLVSFTNLSTGDYNTCEWDFGDGSTSSNCTDPQNTYNAVGTYTVSLTVSGDGGEDTETKTGYISVYTQVATDFSATPTSGIAPLLVSFTNLSTGDYDTCEWDFGDGATSSDCGDPQHTYTSGGVYTVSLTASGGGGEDTETKTGYITVYDPVQADFSATPTSGVAPLLVSFTNLSTGDYDTCEWDFGDGSTSSNCTDPQNTYNAVGTYTVSLTVSGDGGEDTETKTGYISVYTQVATDFSATPTSGIAPLLVSFTNLSTGDYDTCEWDFGDGSTSSDCGDPQHTYNTGGVYTVSLTASGGGGEDTETKTGYITVYDPVQADFSATPTSGVAPLLVSFTNLSTGDYDTCEWDFGDGATSSNCTDPQNTYNAVGTYTVSLTVSGDGGEDTETKTSYISVYTQVTTDFSATPTSGIAPLLVSFTNLSTGDYDTCEWDFGDGGTSSDCGDPQHTYTTGGEYTVSLTASDGGGEDTETKTGYITVYDPVEADFSATPTSGAAPLLVSFTNLSTGDYDTCEWDFGDGTNSTDCLDPDHTYTTTGTFTVELTASGEGGEDTETKTGYISVGVQVVADFSATPTSGITPLLVSFTNLSTGNYDTCEWDFGDGGTSNDCVDPDHTYNTGGVYTVSLTASGIGGEDTETKTGHITVYEPVQAAFSATPTIGVAPLLVSFTNLSTGDYDTCEWDFGDGATSSDCGDPQHTYNTGGVYIVSLTASGGGGEDTETKTGYITVYDPVEADFSATPTSGAAPLLVSFTNLSTGDYDTCEWDFGDGSTSSDCNDPVHTYENIGTYIVTLTINGDGGEDTEIKQNFIVIDKIKVLYIPIILKN